MLFLPNTTYLTTPKPPNYYPDSIELKEIPRKHNLSRNYIYVLGCDSLSLAIFKRIFLLGLKIVIYVDNLDYFFHKFRAFRYMNFVFVEDLPESIDRKTKYLRVENQIRKQAPENYRPKNLSQKPAMKAIEQFEMQREKDLKGVEISFFPKVFDSIRTSLRYPQKYLHTKLDMSSKIYRELLTGKKSIEQLTKVLGVNINNELKSLVFTSIVRLKDGYFYI